MKKILTLCVLASVVSATAWAQLSGSPGIGLNSGDGFKGYNRLGLSYDNESYRNNWDEKDSNFSLNGFGLDYIHGFSLSKSQPMFLEVGANINFMFGNPYSYEEKEGSYTSKEMVKMQNINLQVPVSYTWRFNVADAMYVAPYAGLDFKLHLLRQGKEVTEIKGGSESEKEESDWYNYFDKDEVGEGWKRFQMGWHVGVGFQYSKIYLGLQYGTDFLPAFSVKEYDETAKFNTGNLKLTLSYSF